MNQGLALEIMLSGESVLLTGPAGAGKTFVLNQFIRLAKADGKHVSVTATTGLAATHLGGTTIHSWAGIGVLDYIPQGFAHGFLSLTEDAAVGYLISTRYAPEAASGARYVSGPYEWWNKGDEATLRDLRSAEDEPALATCLAAGNTP